jgi:hypothetical protein
VDKKGLLLAETTVKVIIALIGIVILMTLGWKLAGVIKDDQAMKTAEIHMEAIEEIIDDLVEKGGGEREYILLNPRGWVLLPFPQVFVSDGSDLSLVNYNIESRYCESKGWENCICLCNFPKSSRGTALNPIGNEGVISELNAIKGSCDSLNSCFEVDFDDVAVGPSNRIFTDNLNKGGKSLSISLEEDKLRIVPK